MGDCVEPEAAVSSPDFDLQENKRRKHVQRQVEYRKRKAAKQKEIEEELEKIREEVARLRLENAELASSADAKEMIGTFKDTVVETLEAWKTTAQNVLSAFDIAKVQDTVFSFQKAPLTDAALRILLTYFTPNMAHSATMSFKYRLACLRREIQDTDIDDLDTRQLLERKLSHVLKFRMKSLEIVKEVNPNLYISIANRLFGEVDSTDVPVLSVFLIDDDGDLISDTKSNTNTIDSGNSTTVINNNKRTTYQSNSSEQYEMISFQHQAKKYTKCVRITKDQAEGINKICTAYKARILAMQGEFCRRIDAPLNEAKVISDLRCGKEDSMLYWAAKSSLPTAMALEIMEDYVQQNASLQLDVLLRIAQVLEPLQMCDVILHCYNESKYDLLSLVGF